MARAGVWYTDNISVTDSIVEAPKNFRRCNNLKLKNVTFPNAQEHSGAVIMLISRMSRQREIIILA